MITNNNFLKELKYKNPKALDYILDIYGNLIYRIAYMNLNSKELSEECVNDVLMKVWLSIDGYDYPEDKFKNWIAAIAKYTSIDILRKEKKHFNNVPDEDLNIFSTEELENEYITKEELLIVKKYITHFKEIDRNIFIQRFFMNKSLKEIAEMYNLSPKAVNLRIIRARKKLTELIIKE
ncbi:sigma-70 family RNA polymerase sigma factor [Clostridium paraputrificum]|uniref:sigma-70 family RNA polymerase sigma factor n=1 Tax=Clostridium paraputrificum TaxID=29363 RepID=UPI003D33F013